MAAGALLRPTFFNNLFSDMAKTGKKYISI